MRKRAAHRRGCSWATVSITSGCSRRRTCNTNRPGTQSQTKSTKLGCFMQQAKMSCFTYQLKCAVSCGDICCWQHALPLDFAAALACLGRGLVTLEALQRRHSQDILVIACGTDISISMPSCSLQVHAHICIMHTHVRARPRTHACML